MGSSPLAVIAPNVGALSETFIRRHIDELVPGGAAVVSRWAPGALREQWDLRGPFLDLNRFQRRIRWATVRAAGTKAGIDFDGVVVGRFFRRHGVEVVLGEYLDLSLPWLHLAQKMGLRFFAHAHGIDVSARLREDLWRVRYLEYENSDGVIAMSEKARQDLIDLGLPPHKVHTVPYGVDVPESPPTRSNRNENGVRCVAVGRMAPFKAPIYVLDAFRRAAVDSDGLMLDYVGAGQLLPAVRQFVQALNLDHSVTLHGGQGNATVQKLLARADVFVHHSVTDEETGQMEGLPVAILEAMAQGLPVVATYSGGIHEEVVDGVTGYLVDPGDTEGMAERIAQLAKDKALRHRMGAEGWRRARDCFSWERERRGLLTVLDLEDV